MTGIQEVRLELRVEGKHQAIETQLNYAVSLAGSQGFSLHAEVAVNTCERKKLERICLHQGH